MQSNTINIFLKPHVKDAKNHTPTEHKIIIVPAFLTKAQVLSNTSRKTYFPLGI